MNNVEQIKDILERYSDELYEFSDEIWDLAEVGLEEYSSKEKYKSFLEKEGFRFYDIKNIPTAFRAEWGSGNPVIGITAEYDALPSLSQEENVFTKQINIKNKKSGHGCGHNLLGTGSLTAAIVLKNYMEKNKVTGKVVLLGAPSEERDAGKTFMAREGAFDDLDIALTWHPGSKNQIWTAGSLANVIVKFHFKGVTSHASASPHLGRSALDAAELMNVGVNFLREHVIPEARIHYAFTDVGGTAPNVVQSTSSVYYFIRAPRLKQAMDIYERIQKIAKGAAMMTETEVIVDFQVALSDYIPNRTITKLLYSSMQEFGISEYTKEESNYAKKYYKTLNEEEQLDEIDRLKTDFDQKTCQKIMDKYIVDEISKYDENAKVLAGSTDVGDMSYIVPTAQAVLTTAAMGTPLHSWQMTAQGKSTISKKGMLNAGGILALTGIKVLENKKIVDLAKEELKERVGIKGYVSPIPENVSIRNPKVNP